VDLVIAEGQGLAEAQVVAGEAEDGGGESEAAIFGYFERTGAIGVGFPGGDPVGLDAGGFEQSAVVEEDVDPAGVWVFGYEVALVMRQMLAKSGVRSEFVVGELVFCARRVLVKSESAMVVARYIDFLSLRNPG
jgi:hypothetical protein